jgi:hypothetical protein
MTLTEEQTERMRKNREKALELQKKRKLKDTNETQQQNELNKKRTMKQDDTNEEGIELEEFEVNASAFVTKKDAMKVYCLPMGTLAVCEIVEERENPRNKGFSPMKLYERAEIRRRARERFGGLQGLVEERKKRAEKRFEADFAKAKDIFSSKNK